MGNRQTQRPSTSTGSRNVNVRYLSGLLVVVAVLVIGVVLTHYWQMPKHTAFLRQRAAELVAQGDSAEAVHYLRLYLALCPDDFAAFTDLALQLPKLGTREADFEAHRKLQQVLRRDPENRQAREALLQNCVRQGDYHTAVRQAKRLESMSDLQAEDWRLIARAYRGSENKDAALAAYGRAVAETPHDLNAYREYLDLALRQAIRRRDGEKLLEKMVADNREDPLAYLLSYALRRDHRLPGAEEALAKAKSLGPQNVEVLLMSAGAAMSRDKAQAGKLLRQANQIAPDDPRVLLVYGKWQSEHGDVERALELLCRGHATAGEQSPEFAWRIAEILIEQQRVEEAIPYIAEVKQASLYEPVYLFLRGRTELLGGDIAAAAASFAEGRQLISSSRYYGTADRYRSELLYKFDLGLAGVYFNQRNLSEAIVAAKRAHDTLPSELMPLTTLGSLYYETAQFTDAVQAWRGAIQYPRCPAMVYFELARSLFYEQMDRPQRQRQFKEYLAAMDSARRTIPNLPDLVLLDAEYLLAVGKPAEAVTALVAGTQGHPDNPHLAHSLLRALIATGQYRQALKQLRRIKQKFGQTLALTLAEVALHVRRKEPELAEKLLQGRLAKASAQEQVPILSNLAVLVWNRGDLAEAERLFTQATQVFPDDIEPQANLVEFYLQEGKSQKIQELLKSERAVEDPVGLFRQWCEALLALECQSVPQQAILSLLGSRRQSMQTTRADWWGTLHVAGAVHELRNEPKRAIVDYQRAVRTGPAPPSLVARLARLLVAQNRMGNARELLDRVGRQRLLTPADVRLAKELGVSDKAR